jgi:ABC-type sugar transport system substrate-binding protein
MPDRRTPAPGRPWLRPRAVQLLLVAVLALAFAACGDDDGDGSGSGDAGGGNAQAAAGECAGDGTKVALALHFRGPFPAELERGAKQAAADCGADLQVVGPDDADPPAAVQAARDAVAAGARGVAYVASPPETWRPAIEDFQSSGIEVAALNVPNTDMGDDNPLYVGADEKAIGLALGEAIGEELGPDAQGDAIVGICIAGLGVLEDRVAGVKESLAEVAPGLNVRGPFDVKQEAGQNFAAWGALVGRYPKAKAFIGVCPFDTPSLHRIKKSTGGDWLFGSTDFDGENLRSVQEGGSTVQVGQNPYIQGYVPVRMLIEKIAMGKDMPQQPGGVWISSGVDVVTKENVDEAIARGESDEETAAFYEDQISEIFDDPSAVAQSLADFGS